MKEIIRSILLALPLLFTACGDDGPIVPEVVFPETQTIECAAGKQQPLEFTANQAWSLSSNQMWCRFIQDGAEQSNIEGVAGHHKVTLLVTDEGQAIDRRDEAEITMRCGGQQAVIVKVIRAAVGYQLRVMDGAGNELNEIEVGYGEYAPFFVQANFRFVATKWPDWAQLKDGSLLGVADKKVESGITFVGSGEAEMYEQAGEMQFQDELGKASFTVRITFKGMPHDIVKISRPGNATAWNWTVSADGKTFVQSGNEYKNALTFGLTTYHNDCEVVLVEKTADQTLSIGTATWAHWNKTAQSLAVDENTTDAERMVYVLAFPRAKYDQIKDNLAEAIIVNGDLVYEVGEQNLVVALKQSKPAAKGPDTGETVGFIAESFKNDPDYPEMVETECKNITDEAFLDYCEKAIGTRKVFLLEAQSYRENGMFDMVTPYPYLRYYDDWGDNLAYYTYYNGTRNEERTPDTTFDDSAKPTRWYISGVADSREEPEGYFLVLLNPDKSIMKALFVKTKN